MRRVMQLERQQEQFKELAADPQPLGPICPRRGWEALDMVDLQAEFRCRVRCLQAVPSFLREQFRMALVTSFEAMRAAYHRGDHAQKCRSWKLFRLTSRMLLPEAAWTHQGRVGEKGGPFPQTGVDVVAG